MNKKFIRVLSILLVVLTAVNVLMLVGCDKEKREDRDDEITIYVEVVDDKSEHTIYTIVTKKSTLRGALEQENMIKGEEAQYGLYVKEVCGVVADYDVNQAFWSFTKDGETLMTGVDSTIIEDGDHYEITYTK